MDPFQFLYVSLFCFSWVHQVATMSPRHTHQLTPIEKFRARDKPRMLDTGQVQYVAPELASAVGFQAECEANAELWRGRMR